MIPTMMTMILMDSGVIMIDRKGTTGFTSDHYHSTVHGQVVS
jgi:hypothetical protein